MPRSRNEHLNVRLKPDELAMLRKLAEERGETASAIIRRFIRDRFAATFGTRKHVEGRKRR